MEPLFGYIRQFRKDLGRTEPEKITAFIRLVIIEKCLKGIVLILLCISFFPVFSEEFVEVIRLIAHRTHIFSTANVVTRLFNQYADAPDKQLFTFSIFFLFWGAVELSEGIGLFKRRRWAEYLIVLSNGIFVPIELFTVLTRFSPEKLGLLVFNIILILYLVQSRKLFRFFSS